MGYFNYTPEDFHSSVREAFLYDPNSETGEASSLVHFGQNHGWFPVFQRKNLSFKAGRLTRSNQWGFNDHKNYPVPSTDWPAKAQSYSGNIRAYAAALEATNRRVASAWIHFAVGGGTVELVL